MAQSSPGSAATAAEVIKQARSLPLLFAAGGHGISRSQDKRHWRCSEGRFSSPCTFVCGAACDVWFSPSLTTAVKAVADVGSGWRCSPSSVLCLGKERNSMSIRSNEI